MRRSAVLLSTSRIGKLEHAGVDDAVGLGDPDPLDEIADRLRRHAAAAQSRKRRHARVVPALDVAAAHQLGQHALRQHRVGEVEARELVLSRPRRHRQIIEETSRTAAGGPRIPACRSNGDALDRVRLAVREVVARIDAPCRAGARMARVQDTVEHRVAQVDVARRHVDLGPQHARAVREFAGPHAAEQVEVLLHRRLAERAVPARARSACRGWPASPPATGRRHRPCRCGSGARPTRRAARNSPEAW